MPNGFGRGIGFGRGTGGGMGFGFRGGSLPWPYVGRGRGGLSRCSYYFDSVGMMSPGFYQPQSSYAGMPYASGYAPYSPQMSREDELNYMKDQAEAIKRQLEQIESRMLDLETEK